jgi:transposase
MKARCSGGYNRKCARILFYPKEQRAMSNVPVFVGLDYHEKGVQVCVLEADGRQLANRSCVNDWRALAECVRPFGTDVRAAVESCSGAANLAEELVQRAGWSVALAHAGYVARMKQNPDKTDYQDARLVADLERVGYLPRVWLAPLTIRELRALVHYRQQLVQQRKNTKLRLRSLLREQRCWPPAGIRAWSRAWWSWLTQASLTEQARWLVSKHRETLTRLDGQVREVEQRLERVTAKDPEVGRLREQKGIGPVTAWTLRAEIGRFDRFRTGKQLSRFCGVSPRNASSGQRQADAGLIKAANPALRAVVVEAAHRLIRYEPRWRSLAIRLRQAGKPGSVVAAAVANRWVRWLHHQMCVPATPAKAAG